MGHSSGEKDAVAGPALDACDTPVVATDGQGRVLAWNGAATERFGWDAEEVRGEVCPLAPTAESRDLDRATDAVLGGETIRNVPVTVTDSEGGDHRLSLSLAPLPESGHDGIVATFKPREELAQLRERTRRLEEFAGVVAHDLRGPLNAAMASVQLARDTGDPEHFDRTRRCLDTIEKIIADMLSLCREGQTGAAETDISLAGAAEEAWESVDADDARLAVDDDVSVTAAPSQFQRVLVNLLRNSVEHGSTGHDSQVSQDAGEHRKERVTVRVGPLADGDGFYVADDGPGVPDDRKDSVFDFGYSSEADGTGYGLTIVERIAELHGWSVAVTDSESGGARFEVRT